MDKENVDITGNSVLPHECTFEKLSDITHEAQPPLFTHKIPLQEQCQNDPPPSLQAVNQIVSLVFGGDDDEEDQLSEVDSLASLSSLSSLESDFCLDSPPANLKRVAHTAQRSRKRKRRIIQLQLPELETVSRLASVARERLILIQSGTQGRLPVSKEFVQSGLYHLESQSSLEVGRQKFIQLTINYGLWMLNNERDFKLPFDISYEVQNKLVTLDLQPPQWQRIRRNLYVERQKRSIQPQPCECLLPVDGQLGCLDDCINHATFIECGKNCPLGDQCSNQRFKKKQFVKELQVFSSCDKRGFGLKTLTDIQKGSLIQEYMGEIISNQECERRMNEDYKSAKCFYFLDYQNGEVIDGTRKGSEVRFVNHSCDPNCHIEKWLVDGEIAVGLFAAKYIPAGTELTYDYNFHTFGANRQSCLCGAQNCRGWMGKANEVKQGFEKQQSSLKDDHAPTGGRKKIKNTTEFKLDDQCQTVSILPERLDKVRKQSPKFTSPEIASIRRRSLFSLRLIRRKLANKVQRKSPVRRQQRRIQHLGDIRNSINLSLMRVLNSGHCVFLVRACKSVKKSRRHHKQQIPSSLYYVK
ncbi:hypothetical protein MIR68_006305 [Amoeboaphelidium protococcarum]|nr:hypothetical protein MIR68_006305 [Amoeboaphelidium protococcarum]